MRFSVPCRGGLALALAAALPTALAAQSAPDLRTTRCQLADEPTPQTPCRPLSDTAMPSGVTVVVASDGRSVLVDGTRVAATFGFGVPDAAQGVEAVVAEGDRDVVTTGSIKDGGARK